MFPIRCYTCNKVVANKWEKYCKLIKIKAAGEVLTELGYDRYCCRTMFLTHVEEDEEYLTVEDRGPQRPRVLRAI